VPLIGDAATGASRGRLTIAAYRHADFRHRKKNVASAHQLSPLALHQPSSQPAKYSSRGADIIFRYVYKMPTISLIIIVLIRVRAFWRRDYLLFSPHLAEMM